MYVRGGIGVECGLGKMESRSEIERRHEKEKMTQLQEREAAHQASKTRNRTKGEKDGILSFLKGRRRAQKPSSQ